MQSFTASLHSLRSTLQNGFNMLGMMMQQNHQQNQHLQYNHPQYQQQQSNMSGVWHLQDPSHFKKC